MKSPAAVSCHGIHTFSYSAPQRCINSLSLKTQKRVFKFKNGSKTTVSSRTTTIIQKPGVFTQY